MLLFHPYHYIQFFILKIKHIMLGVIVKSKTNTNRWYKYKINRTDQKTIRYRVPSYTVNSNYYLRSNTTIWLARLLFVTLYLYFIINERKNVNIRKSGNFRTCKIILLKPQNILKNRKSDPTRLPITSQELCTYPI